ncbi:MAG: tRNA uridine-5-carboxymethylaminomethyl(34) synthesis GTPase MnmE [Bacillota bacterium]
MYIKDTIAAISTAIGEGGIGIVRISGPEAITVADQIFVSDQDETKSLAAADTYTAHYGHIVEPQSKEVVDEVICLVMKAPRTYTKEDIVEINCHGGAVPVQKVLDVVLNTEVRLAEPGEFTKRAFLNGRLDLSQAEAITDIITSQTEAGLQAAMDQLEGGLSAEIEQIKDRVLELLAHLEASIDFPDDEIEDFDPAELEERVAEVVGLIEDLLASSERGKIIREGIQTAIIGKPNVGKSSLLNALLREKRAIVTEVPGTTRDVIEEVININGVPLKIIDTAGIREAEDEVEQIGVEKSEEFLKRADLVLLVLDAADGITTADEEIIELAEGKDTIVVVNKIDLESEVDIAAVKEEVGTDYVVQTAAIDGNGIDELEELISDLVLDGKVQSNDQTLVTNLRHKQALEAAYESIKRVEQTISQGLPADFATIDLKEALEELGKITGDTVDEDIIDRIFADFCLGK